jgi:hypothetical protein
MRLHGVPLGIAAVVVVGCAGPYLYRPTDEVDTTVAGYPASRYEIPPGTSSGNIVVGSFGFTQLDLPNGRRGDFLHARVIIANDKGEDTWTLAPESQLVALPGQTPGAPAYVNSPGPIAPKVEIPPGRRVTLDLFYLPPAGLQRASRVPAFDLLWTVEANGKAVAGRTSFERLEIPPDPWPYSYALSFGPTWYVDPWWYGVAPPLAGWWYQPMASRYFAVSRPARVWVQQPNYAVRPVGQTIH